jgi:tetratricopeptide (TPR) repeat protein
MSNRLMSTLCVGAIVTIFSAAGAQGAVTVIGAGAAQLCYQGADTGQSSIEYVQYCNEALAGVLTKDDRAATYINRGVLELLEMKVNAAQDDFNAGLSINDGLGEGYVDRGATLIAQKKYAEAIADINKGISLGSKEPQLAYFDRAMANEALGNLRAAYEDYRQSLVIAPDFTRASDELKRFKVVEKPSGV